MSPRKTVALLLLILYTSADIGLLVSGQFSILSVSDEAGGRGGGEEYDLQGTKWVDEMFESVAVEKRVTDMTSAEAYLLKFGYFGPGITRKILDVLPNFLRKAMIRDAMIKYQKLMGISATGELTEMSMKMMSIPRCGLDDSDAIQKMLHRNSDDVDDVDDEEMSFKDSSRRKKRSAVGVSRMKRFATRGGRKWPSDDMPITWSLRSPTNQLGNTDQLRAIQSSLEFWARESGVTFRRTNSRDADFIVRFAEGSHGDNNDFDGKGGTLAHAFYPGNYALAGDAHFDNRETWVIRDRGGTDLVPVAIHEFGHSLGLAHSDVVGSIMWPTAYPYISDLKLHEDDIMGIQSLYGPPSTRRPDRPTRQPVRPTRRPVRPTRRPTQPTRRPEPTEPPYCDGKIDAIVWDGEETIAFRGPELYYLEDDGGVKESYPRLISSEYPGFPPDTRVTAALTIGDHMYLFVEGSQVYRVRLDTKHVTGPRKQSDVGVPDDKQVQAGFTFDVFKKVYLFTGGEYLRFSTDTGSMDPGYPKDISKWEGAPSQVDATTMWSNGRLYFFSGEDYYRYDIRKGKITSGYPKSTATHWMGC